MMISLPDLQVLEIAGADAMSFAHAQFSSDVRALGDGAWQWSAWLSPQGRVRAFFQLLRDDSEHLRMLLRGGDAAALCSALRPYVLRAKVSLRVADAVVLGSYETAPRALALPGPTPRWLQIASDAREADTSIAAKERWRLEDIRAGLPMLPGMLLGELLPQWLGIERLGAVSVKKGCYPGQEVMSRLHFKGGNKRALYRIELIARTPSSGMALMMQAEMAGSVVMVARREDGGIEALASLADSFALAPNHLLNAGIAVLERFS